MFYLPGTFGDIPEETGGGSYFPTDLCKRQGIQRCLPDFRLFRMLYRGKSLDMFQTFLCSGFDFFQIIHHHHTCENVFGGKMPVCEAPRR